MKKACRDEIIDYDLLGNPVRIQFTDRSCTEYVYAADGRRLKTTHTTAVLSSTHLALGEMVLLSPTQILSVDSTEYLGNFLFATARSKSTILMAAILPRQAHQVHTGTM